MNDAQRFPSWYARPGNVPRTAAGDSSFRWAGTTPQAPWTANWIRNAPVARPATVLEPIQGCIMGSARRAAAAMVLRRPNLWDIAPNRIPPAIAPMLATIEIMETVFTGRPRCLSRNPLG